MFNQSYTYRKGLPLSVVFHIVIPYMINQSIDRSIRITNHKKTSFRGKSCFAYNWDWVRRCSRWWPSARWIHPLSWDCNNPDHNPRWWWTRQGSRLFLRWCADKATSVKTSHMEDWYSVELDGVLLFLCSIVNITLMIDAITVLIDRWVLENHHTFA